MAKIICTACRTISELPDEYLGRQVRCVKCKAIFVATAVGGQAGRPSKLKAPPATSRPPAAPDTDPAPEAPARRPNWLVPALAGGCLALMLVIALGVTGALIYLGRSGGPKSAAAGSEKETDPARGAVAVVDPSRDKDEQQRDRPPDEPSRGQDPPAGGKPPAGSPPSDKPPDQVPEAPLGRVSKLDLGARIKPDKLLPPPTKADPPVPAVWDGHTNHIRGVAFTDDGKYVVSVSGDVYPETPARKADNSVRLWDVRWGKQVHKVEGFAEPLDGVSVSPGGRYAVFGHSGHWEEGPKWVDSTDHGVRLWDLETKREVLFEEKDGEPGGAGGGTSPAAFRGLDSSVFCTAISPDNSRVVGGANSGRLVYWDAKSGASLVAGQVPFTGFFKGVVCVKYTPDGRNVLTVSADYKLRLYDAQTGQLGLTLGNHQDIVWALSVASAGGRVLALSGGGSRQRRDGKGFEDGARDYVIRLWDLDQGKEVRRFVGHERDVTGLAFCPNGRQFVSGSNDRTVRLWDLESGRELRLLGRHEKSVRSVAVSPDGRSAVSGGDDCKVRFWRLPAPGPDLVAAVEKDEPAAFEKAIADLELMGPADLIAYPALVQALNHADPKFHSPAARALAFFAEFCDKNNASLKPPHVAELAKALKSAQTADERYAVALAAAVIGADAKELVPPLREVATGGDEVKVVVAAVKALGKIGDASRETVDVLERALRHQESAVRREAVLVLTRLGPAHVKLKTFLELVGADASPEVRSAADKALRDKLESLTKEDVPQLREALKSGKAPACVICADAVAKLGAQGAEAAAELAALLDRDDREVLLHAIRALRAIGKGARSASGELLRLAEKGEDKRIRCEGAVALSKIDPENTEVLTKLMEVLILAQKPEAAEAIADKATKALAADAAGALVRVGTPAVIDRLIKALERDFRGADDVDTAARCRIYEIIEQLKDKANYGENPQLIGKCCDREKGLVQNPRYNNDLHREAYKKSKSAVAAVYNAPQVKKGDGK